MKRQILMKLFFSHDKLFSAWICERCILVWHIDLVNFSVQCSDSPCHSSSETVQLCRCEYEYIFSVWGSECEGHSKRMSGDLVCGSDGRSYDVLNFKCEQDTNYGKRKNLQFKHYGDCFFLGSNWVLGEWSRTNIYSCELISNVFKFGIY